MSRDFSQKQYSFIRVFGGIILIAVVLYFIIRFPCPTKYQYFFIYSFFILALALFFYKGLKKGFLYGNSNGEVSFKILGASSIIIICLFYFNPIKWLYGKDACDSLSNKINIVVFVYDANKGKQEMILRQQGKVILDLGSERKSSSINENGQAFFQNLHIGDSVKLEIDFSEPYKSACPDSIFIINSDHVYLPIFLKGNGYVNGTVIYNSSPLVGVTVRINNLTTQTDKNGYYNITIPDSLKSDEYQVWFVKEGFKSRMYSAHPQYGRSLNITMDK